MRRSGSAPHPMYIIHIYFVVCESVFKDHYKNKSQHIFVEKKYIYTIRLMTPTIILLSIGGGGLRLLATIRVYKEHTYASMSVF